MDFLNDLWFSITYRVRRAFYFSFKRFKWFLGIKEPPLISVVAEKMPSEVSKMIGGMEGMLLIRWQRRGKGAEGFQLQDFEYEHLLKSSKKQTFETLPADVEKALKEKYGEKTNA
tara:strand:- start:258 stop:602 length:345 start_codon:yes stop_codon:yes gene_type:complete